MASMSRLRSLLASVGELGLQLSLQRILKGFLNLSRSRCSVVIIVQRCNMSCLRVYCSAR
jgi:hypothetical protein